MDIVQETDPVLRETATSVLPEEFGTPVLTDILEKMAAALDAEPDGVALAAPQIGISKRIFLVRFDRMLPAHHEPTPPELGVFINPEFVKVSRRRVEMEEGCLSVRGRYGKTLRHERATVHAQDAAGTWFTRGGGGILAQAFQHEMDHLDGMLFIDHAHALREVAPESHA